jgi:uncharacterized protein YjbJ (UPF0337 family)
MNRDTAQGNWQQLKGKIKQKWGKLTDDDMTRAEGDKDYLVGKLHEQYGLAKDRAHDELKDLGYREEEADVDERSSNRSGAGRMEMAGRDTSETGGAVNSTYDNNERSSGGIDSRETGGRVSEGNAGKRSAGSESVDEDIRAAGYGEQDQQNAHELKAGFANAEGQSPRNKLEATSRERQDANQSTRDQSDKKRSDLDS